MPNEPTQRIQPTQPTFSRRLPFWRLSGVVAGVLMLHLWLLGSLPLPALHSQQAQVSMQMRTIRQMPDLAPLPRRQPQSLTQSPTQRPPTQPKPAEAVQPAPADKVRTEALNAAPRSNDAPALASSHMNEKAEHHADVFDRPAASSLHDAHQAGDEPAEPAKSAIADHVVATAASAAPPASAAIEPASEKTAQTVVAASPEGSRIEVPIYPTLLPPPFDWRLVMKRAGQKSEGGEARLYWQLQGEGYEAELTASEHGVEILNRHSTGTFSTAGVSPERYVDRGRGRGAQAANFQRELGKITYSGPSVEWPFLPGAQDRLSWLIQLSAIVNADTSRAAMDSRTTMMVSGARGDVEIWTFIARGLEEIDGPDGPIRTWCLEREPSGLYDTRVAVWLDPARHALPVRWRMSHGEHVQEFILQKENSAP